MNNAVRTEDQLLVMNCAIIIVLFFGAYSVSAEDSSEKYNPDLDLKIPQMIRRYGYPSESHVVKTEDGYLLTLHRIPHGKNNTGNQRKVVFLMHGLTSSSSDFVIMGPDKGLGYILADYGYDVWMGNYRGNLYSLGHDKLSTSDPKYWDFSFHEIGIYDLPASIDYILEKVNQKSLFFICHSMGCTSFFVMTSVKPEYGLKVKAMFGLAPVAYNSHMKSPIRLLAPWANDVEFLASHVGVGAISANSKFMKYLGKYVCSMFSWEEEICSNLMFVVTGFDADQLNKTTIPIIIAHASAGTSTKTLVHYAQETNSGKFQKFDFGKAENLIRYGSPVPPEYNLSNIKTPIALYYARNDWLADPIDVEQLYKQLKRKIGKFLVDFHNFNHIDFIYGIDAKKLVYNQVLKIMSHM